MSAPQSDDFGKEWCPDCRRRVTVVDQFEESRYERHGEVAFRVQLFACGHSWEGGEHVIGAAPGAPSVAGAYPNLRALWRSAFDTPDPWAVEA